MSKVSVHIVTGIEDLNRIQVSPPWSFNGSSGPLFQVKDLYVPHNLLGDWGTMLKWVSQWLVGRQVVLLPSGEWADEGVPICSGWVNGKSLKDVMPVGPHFQFKEVRHVLAC